MTNIKKVRESKQMSRYYIAKQAKLGYTTLVAIEKGGDLRVSTLYKIAEALEVKASELLLTKEE